MLRKIWGMIKCQKGFTIVELLAVIAIIGVLAAIAIPKFSQSAEDAKVAKVQSDLRNLDSTIAAAVAGGTIIADADLTAADAEASNTTVTALKPYFQGDKLPIPPIGWQGGKYAVASGVAQYVGTSTVTSVSTTANIKAAK